MTENQLSKNTSNDNLTNVILQALELRVTELQHDVNVSQQLLDVGVYTDLTNTIKKVIENPLSHLLATRDELNSNIASLITLFVKGFFKFNKDIISTAFVTDTKSNNELHFSIVLKDDNYTTRESIFTFLTDYKSSSLWESYPLFFQIVPENISHKIPRKELLFEN